MNALSHSPRNNRPNITAPMANPQLPYDIVATVRRRIPKFNMQGTEYRITIPAIQQNDLPFNIVNAMVHDVFARE